MNVKIEPIGRIMHSIDGNDEYVLMSCDEDVSIYDMRSLLIEKHYTLTKGPGSYFCTSVQVVPHAQVGKYIGIICHRYDV